MTWRRISSRRDICSLSFLSTLDSYSACGGETKARQLQKKNKDANAREAKRELFFWGGFRLFSSATYELVHIVLSELRHRRSASLRPRLLSLSLSLSLASRARFCSFRHAPPLSFPFLDEAFHSHVDRFFCIVNSVRDNSFPPSERLPPNKQIHQFGPASGGTRYSGQRGGSLARRSVTGAKVHRKDGFDGDRGPRRGSTNRGTVRVEPARASRGRTG